MNSLSNTDSKETSLLLDWYDANARQLAWRIGPRYSKRGMFQEPYKVWLSEIMLQQTQVTTVHAYFLKFIQRWPSLQEMAAADLEDVLKMWAGLGYYSRARNLKKCADLVIADYDGKFPHSASELKKLPGIGDYTSAAIAAIAHGENIAVVDGNVERVMTRRHEISTPLPAAKNEIRKLVSKLVPSKRPGDFAQAMMDLGATICLPKSPDCGQCPWSDNCGARNNSTQTSFPVKAPKKAKPLRHTAAFVMINDNHEIYLRKRSESGMLAGMSEVPSGDWSVRKDGAMGVDAAPITGEWREAGTVRHVFTHFTLEMKVYFCDCTKSPKMNGWWVHRNAVMDEALPSLMKKAIALVLEELK